MQKQLPPKRQKIGRAVWIPASPEQLQLMASEADKEFINLGRWLLKVGFQEAAKRQRRRAA